jgi:hypothetical protein
MECKNSKLLSQSIQNTHNNAFMHEDIVAFVVQIAVVTLCINKGIESLKRQRINY